MPDRDITALADGFYAAVTGDAPWQRPIEVLLHKLGGTSGSLMLFPSGPAPPELLAMPGFTPKALALYADYYHSVDLWAEVGKLRPSMRSVLGQEHVAPAEYERSEVWNDYSREHVGAFHLLGALFPLAEGTSACIGLHRPRDQEPFSAEEAAWLDGLLPHLRTALLLARRFREAEERGVLGQRVLDQLDYGVVVARSDATVVFANAAAVELAGLGDAFRLGSARQPLSARSPEAARTLRLLVADAATGGPGGPVALPRESGASVAALVTPLPPPLSADFPTGSGLALVILNDLGNHPVTPDVVLQTLFGLTKAEARLAAALAAGQRPEDFAEQREVRVSTVRSQIHTILQKTGTSRQADLVSLIARLQVQRNLRSDG